MTWGRLLARMTVAPVLLCTAWLAVSSALLLAGAFGPGPAFALFLPAAALALWRGWRYAPAPDGGPRAPWWSPAGVALVTAGFLAAQIAMRSEQVIVRRDPGAYAQIAIWLGDHGSLPIPQARWAFGGGDPALEFGGPGFAQVGEAVVPTFAAGLPLLLALGGWIGGVQASLLTAPLLGAGAVLTFGGLTARLVGPRWAPVGALLLALTAPMIWVSRAAFSELPALVLLLGGLCLLHDARPHARDGRYRGKALLAGLAFGLVVLVRIDGLRDVLPVAVAAVLLTARRRRAGPMLAAGLTAGAGAGLAAGLLLTRPHPRYPHDSPVPLLLGTALALATAGGLAFLLRGRHTGPRLKNLTTPLTRGWPPNAATALPLAAVAALAARPLAQTVRSASVDGPAERFVAEVQRLNGLPADPARQYAEISLYWVIWYVGVPVLLLAAVAAGLLLRRLLLGRAPGWGVPLAVVGWATATALWRPAVAPDHPWASRRLADIVIPGLVLLAVWGAAWTVRRFRCAGYGTVVVAAAAWVAVTTLAAPVALASAWLWNARTDQGEIAAVRGLCARLGPGRSVVALDRPTADRFLPVVRSMCGLPAAAVTAAATPDDVRRVADRVYRAGRRPVLLAADPALLVPHGPVAPGLALRTRQDERTLLVPPGGTLPLEIDVWLTSPPRR
ncbi:hypothetical protein [Actinomadura kijaniata]|uniref:hypothetical protein n=1 Tax=Actinomadura kijaniata TaxID=46161 RepID=UPI00082C3A24|nr:hypothetical protein [Actinomadura kijaniata]